MGFFSNLGRIATGVVTLGGSEIIRNNVKGASNVLDKIDTGMGVNLGAGAIGGSLIAGLWPAAGAAAAGTAGVGGATSAAGAAGASGALGTGLSFSDKLLMANMGAGVFGAYQQAQAQRDANQANIDIANQQMAFSADQAERQMAFQENMSNTAVQRMKADMMAAGINPMLAAGAGESTPSGAMGSYNRANVEAVPSVVANSLTSAVGAINLLQNLRESNSRIASNYAGARLSGASADTKAVEGYTSVLLKRILSAVVNSGKKAYNVLTDPNPKFDIQSGRN